MIYENMPNREYHNAAGISKSGLDLIRKGPDVFEYQVLNGNRPAPTAAMEFGSALHSWALQPGDFKKEVAILPTTINRRTKKGKIEYQEFINEAKGKVIVKQDIFDQIKAMGVALEEHPAAGSILRNSKHRERSFFVKHHGVCCKIRPDIECPHFLADLKTIKSTEYNSLQKSILAYRYHVQAAFYLDVYNASDSTGSNIVSEFVLVFIEKEEPYRVACYQLNQETIEFGRAEYMADLNVYSECLETGKWPGPNNGKIGTIGVPEYALR